MFVYKDNLRRGFNNYLDKDKEPMNIHFGILHHVSGEFEMFLPSETEKFILVLSGDVEIEVGNKKTEIIKFSRRSVFTDFPKAIHIDKNETVKIVFNSESEVLFQEINNNAEFKYICYDEKNIKIKKIITNKGPLSQANRYIFDLVNQETAPLSNLVFGETITLPGNWAGFPSHSHPQPELAFFKFQKEEGFGAIFVDEIIFHIRNNSLVCLPSNSTHPYVTAPGYLLWNAWTIKNEKNAKFTGSKTDEKYEWVSKASESYYSIYDFK